MALVMNVQIIVITELCTDVLCPTLLTSSDEFEHTTFIRSHITIDAAEVVPMVFHPAVLFASSGEVEPSPCLNFFRLADLPQAIYASQVTLTKQVNVKFQVPLPTCRIDFHSMNGFRVVCSCFVIQDGIPQNANTTFTRSVGHLYQLLFRAPLCGAEALPIKLAEVVKVIEVVAVAISPASFTSGRDPHLVNPNPLELRQDALQPLPMAMVCRYIPFESLKHGGVDWICFLWTHGPIDLARRFGWDIVMPGGLGVIFSRAL
jgi:hypothetical protein